MSLQMNFKKPIYFAVLILHLMASCSAPTQELTVKDVMDKVVSRFYSDFELSQLDTIGTDFILHYLLEEEKKVLSTGYWFFDVNVPVTVSVMRDAAQQVVPFWLEEAGFQKT